MTTDLEKVLQIAQRAALEAGAVIRDASASRRDDLAPVTKSSSTDLVTETDRRCELLITERIQREFPDHAIIGEEDSGSDRYVLTDGPTWTVDPIDGTTNFVHRLRLSCVIVSFLEGKEVRAGVIYDPYADELFFAVKGKGSFLREGDGEPVPIRVSNTKKISDAVISMDPGYGRDPDAVRLYCAVQGAVLSRSVRNVRVVGCTGLNMAWAACGRLDGGFEEGSWETGRGPKIWDFAAGRLLVEEAGGITRDLESPPGDDAPLDLTKRSFFCAATVELAGEVLECIVEGRSKC